MQSTLTYVFRMFNRNRITAVALGPALLLRRFADQDHVGISMSAKHAQTLAVW